jgi:glyceraldehyde-3-phosphate dehydrogenase (NADP+)
MYKSCFPNKNLIPENARIDIPINQNEYLVNGEIKIWEGEIEHVYSPIYIDKNGILDNYIGSFPKMDEKTALTALESAVNAYGHGRGEWPSMSIEKRIDCIKEFLIVMKEQREIVVRLLMWEIGKSRVDSEKEFDRTFEYIQETIEALKEIDRSSSSFTMKQGIIAQIRRSPLGVVLCMGPFNYPLNETFTTLIPAIIMGNTVVFKPPKLGVLLLAPLLKAFQKAFPKGVVNTIYGDGKTVVTPIMQSGKIDVFAFIGTSRVADILKKLHPYPHRLRSILGLDAKNPAIVLDDVDIEIAVNECLSGALSFNGQRCTAIKIIFVHHSIHDEFIETLVSRVEELKIGMPWETDVKITPLPEPEKTKILNDYIEDAIHNGAKLCNPSGGKNNLSLFYPAVISNINKNMKLYNEEQFGPIIPVVTFNDIEEPLKYVITSDFGQQASIFGNDSKTIAKLIDTLVNQVCRVNINSQCQRGPDILPFTGRKDSAEGTLSVTDALRVFSIRTLTAFKETKNNKQIITDILKNNESIFLSTDFIF